MTKTFFELNLYSCCMVLVVIFPAFHRSCDSFSYFYAYTETLSLLMVLTPAAAICTVLLLLFFFYCCCRKRTKRYVTKLYLLMFCLDRGPIFLYLLFISEKFLIMTQPCTLEAQGYLRTKCRFTTAQKWLIFTPMEAISLFTKTPHLCLSIPSRYFVIWVLTIYKEISEIQNTLVALN